MRKLNKKFILITAFVLILSSTVVANADTITNIKGFFSTTIKIFNNGLQTSLGIDDATGKAYQPLVVDGRTYLPVRAIANLFNKDIQWEQATSSIKMNDKPDSSQNNLIMQLVQEQQKVKTLEAKVKELEAKLKEKEKESEFTTLKEMQKYLNDEYDVYNRVNFEIKLSGKTSDIDVKIYVDSKSNTKWKNFKDSEIKDLISSIVSDVQDNFPKADIEGYIENDYTGKTEIEFYVNSKGKLVINEYTGYDDYDALEFQDFLNDEYGRVGNKAISYKVYIDNEYVEIDFRISNTNWNSLSKSEQNELIDYILWEADEFFPKHSVELLLNGSYLLY